MRKLLMKWFRRRSGNKRMLKMGSRVLIIATVNSRMLSRIVSRIVSRILSRRINSLFSKVSS